MITELQCIVFSHDVMLSSNMAASIATEVNIHLCKHLFALLRVTLSPWTPLFVDQAHDDHVRAWCAWLPWISRSVCAIQWPCWRTAWSQWKCSICEIKFYRWTVFSFIFQTFEKIVGASKEELALLPGFGTQKVKKITLWAFSIT